MSDKTPEQKQDCVASQMAVDWYIRLLTEEPAVAIKEAYQVGYQAAKPQWISVKERLPEDGEQVFVIYSGKHCKDVHLSYYENGWSSLVDVTHWMPLPKPPKGEG